MRKVMMRGGGDGGIGGIDNIVKDIIGRGVIFDDDGEIVAIIKVGSFSDSGGKLFFGPGNWVGIFRGTEIWGDENFFWGRVWRGSYDEVIIVVIEIERGAIPEGIRGVGSGFFGMEGDNFFEFIFWEELGSFFFFLEIMINFGRKIIILVVLIIKFI